VDRCFNGLAEGVNEGWRECGIVMELMLHITGCGDEERNQRD